MDVMEKLTEAVDILNEVDEYASTLNNRLSILNGKQQDLLHYIENNKISIFWCYRMLNEIKTIRIERRKVKQDIELLAKYDMVKNRLTSKDNRPFVLSELHKKAKQLDSTYVNKQYTEEELNKVLQGVK